MEPWKSLVVALGNPLAGPDGFGAAVLARVSTMSGLVEVADLRDAHTDLLAEIDRLARYGRVVLIDTILGVAPSGQVAVYDENCFARWSDASPSGHQISPLMAVKLLRHLHPGAPPEMFLVGWSVDRISRDDVIPEAAVRDGARLVVDLVFTARSSAVASPSGGE